MEKMLEVKLGSWPLKRVALHLVFWVIAYFMFSSLYAVQVKYTTSLRNNLLYVPVHIAYYYILAYWLVPRYLFTAKYIRFVLILVAIMAAVALSSRLIAILLVNPYLISHEPIDDPDFLAETQRPFSEQFLHPVFLVNSWKATNMMVWVSLVIKLFKLWAERKQAALQAELNALKAQVHPHFLFNTLNNLYALTLTNSPKSSQVVLGLSDILRYMLYECNAAHVPLKQEVLVLQQYISLEKLRYEERLDLNFNIEGNLDGKFISPLIMLPFVENAFKHGASEKQGQVWININLVVTGNVLKFKVSNSKPEDVWGNADKQQGHIGLQNVKKRLELLYPSTHQFKILDDSDAYLIVLELELSHRNKTEPQLVPA